MGVGEIDVDAHPVQTDGNKSEEVMCGTPAVTIDLRKRNLMKKVVIRGPATTWYEAWKGPAKHFDRTL